MTISIYEKLFNHAKSLNNFESAYQAAFNYLATYARRSEFTEVAFNYLTQNSQTKKAMNLFNISNDKLTRALLVAPNSARLLNNKAWNSALCNQNLDQAEQEVNKAIKLEPKNAHYWDTLAEIYLRQGKLEKALKTSEKAYNFSFNEISFRDRHHFFVKRVKNLKNKN